MNHGWPRPAFWLTGSTAVALGLVLAYELIHLGFYNGPSQLDDGVYFGEGVMLAHGLLPYHSYLDLQPPGIAVIMTPFGLIGRLTSNRFAFELATAFVAAVSVANIGLLGRLLRRRHWVGVLTGLVVFGFYLDSLYSEHTILLEPFLVFGTLLAFLIIFDDTEIATPSANRWLAAGVVLGLTTSVKLWEVFVVVVVLVLAAARGRRCLTHFVVGAIAGAGIVCTPFLLLAPANFFREVIIVQITRSHLGQISEKFRLWNLLGVPGPGHQTLALSLWIPVALWLIFALIVCFSTIFGSWAHLGQTVTNLDAGAMACALFVGVSFLVGTEFDRHYGGFFAPFLALVLSATAVRLLPLARPLMKIVIATAMLSYFALSVRFVLSYAKQPLQTAAIDHFFSPTACVLSEAYSPLILANRYNLFEQQCPRALDIYGTELANGNGLADSSSDASAMKLQSDWLRWLRRADGFVLFSPISNNPNLGPAARFYFHSHFSLASNSDGLFIYRRDSNG